MLTPSYIGDGGLSNIHHMTGPGDPVAFRSNYIVDNELPSSE